MMNLTVNRKSKQFALYHKATFFETDFTIAMSKVRTKHLEGIENMGLGRNLAKPDTTFN